ncbi:MAG: hypothetical protein C0615_02850 [Desulfuromonas sp.]|nr:MAG: hypothetical protein C0615_02850 [Desulfuromonas sp.]
MNDILSDQFQFWTPEAGEIVTCGPAQEQIPLPSIPLPIRKELFESDRPTDDAIGTSVYDYLREFPECPNNTAYAEILRDAYPHYLADLGAHIVMLDHKDVEAPYIKRKITSMQILLLLDPHNQGLLQQLGINFYQLALMFPELPHCRRHLAKAMQYLSRAGEDATSLNYLARIDYLIGDFPKAIERWTRVVQMIDDPPTEAAINEQITLLQQAGEPDRSLLEDLEAIGAAMRMIADHDITGAKSILERLEEEGSVPEQFPNPEFYYMLGFCREKLNDAAGAVASYNDALALDPDHAPSQQGIERVAGGGN